MKACITLCEEIFILLFSLLEVVNTLVYIDQFINNICVKTSLCKLLLFMVFKVLALDDMFSL